MTVLGSDLVGESLGVSRPVSSETDLDLYRQIDLIARRWGATALGVYSHQRIADEDDNVLIYGWDEEENSGSLILDEAANFALHVQWRRLLGHAEVSFDGPSVVRVGGNVTLRYVTHPSVSTATYIVVCLHSDPENAAKCSLELDAALCTKPLTIEPEAVTLTRRELETARWVSVGKTSSEIATILKLSEHTVNDYIRSGMKKMGSTNRLSFIAKTIRQGLLS